MGRVADVTCADGKKKIQVSLNSLQKKNGRNLCALGDDYNYKKKKQNGAE